MNRIIFAAALIGSVLCASSGLGAIVLNNGSFESIGTQYSVALGGLYEPTGWTNNSGLNIQASSMLAGQEGTNAGGATGNRILRLASDNPNPTNTGFIVQNMGTMVAGELYTITGDVFGGSGAVLTWGATVRLASDGGLSPTTVFDEQILDGYSAGAVGTGAISLSYLATALDNGNPLFIWLRAKPSGAGQAVRGGVDNLQLTVTPPAVPEPGTMVLAGISFVALLCLGWRRRQTS